MLRPSCVACVLLVFIVRLSSAKRGQQHGQVETLNLLRQLLTSVGELQKEVTKIKQDVTELKSAANQQSLTKNTCPPDFTYVSAVNGCYKVLLENLEWLVAGVRCRSIDKDAHLVVINNQQEQDAVASILGGFNDSSLATAGCSTHGTFGYGFWTAGQRIDPSRQSDFIYRVTGESGCNGERLTYMNYTNWYPGQPDYGVSAESCMHLLQKSNYMWNDIRCDPPFCSLCEIDI